MAGACPGGVFTGWFTGDDAGDVESFVDVDTEGAADNPAGSVDGAADVAELTGAVLELEIAAELA